MANPELVEVRGAAEKDAVGVTGLARTANERDVVVVIKAPPRQHAQRAPHIPAPVPQGRVRRVIRADGRQAVVAKSTSRPALWKSPVEVSV